MWLDTKDGRKLSLRQYNVLLHYFDDEYDIADQYIMEHNYKQISETIGKAINEAKLYLYNEKYEDYGCRW